jgi:hypothetical protein
LEPLSAKVGRFTESVIRMMTQVSNRHGGINLAQAGERLVRLRARV